MANNEISEIIPGTFEKMSCLETLVLNNNLIELLESNLFNGLVNLKVITLQGNKLQYIHPNTFLGLLNLQDLQIPNDHSVINSFILKSVAISGCNASLVTLETFANIRALIMLDLSYTNLRSLDINILKVLPNLSAIYL
jgi:Leucine-rich repeat (LRR) protein